MPLSGNKGEWAELLVTLRLLAGGDIPVVDSDLRPLGRSLRVRGVHRFSGTDSPTRYEIPSSGEVLYVDDELEIDLSEIQLAQSSILAALTDPACTGSFSIVEIETLLARLRVTALTASNANKGDVIVLVLDSLDGSLRPLPFSIKSQMAASATLLNASGATNFRTRIQGDHDVLARLQGANLNPKELWREITESGLQYSALLPTSVKFRRNLEFVDSRMPELAGHLLDGYYRSVSSRLKDLVSWVAENDPMELGGELEDRLALIQHKVKTLLLDIALGMVPSRAWDGSHLASGGYLIVTATGEVVCLYSLYGDEFKSYLLKNTKFDTPSRSKHGFGQLIPSAPGTMDLSLNMQIRFC